MIKSTDFIEFVQKEVLSFPKNWKGFVRYNDQEIFLTDNLFQSILNDNNPFDMIKIIYEDSKYKPYYISANITEFSFSTKDYDYSTKWQRFLLIKYPDYLSRLQDYAEANISNIDKKYEEIINRLKSSQEKELRPYEKMLSTAQKYDEREEKLL